MLNSIISSFWYTSQNYFWGMDYGGESGKEVKCRESPGFFHMLILCPPAEQNLAPNAGVLLSCSRMSRQACGNGRESWCVVTPEIHWEIYWLESKRTAFFKEDFKPDINERLLLFNWSKILEVIYQHLWKVTLTFLLDKMLTLLTTWEKQGMKCLWNLQFSVVPENPVPR